MKAVVSWNDEQDPQTGRDVKITYVGNLRSLAQTYLNVNAFPAELHDLVEAAATRFAILHGQIKLIHAQVEIDKPRFIQHIMEPTMELEAVLKKATPNQFVARYDGIELLAAIHALFYLLKSFLDVYAAMLCRMIARTERLTFERDTVNGRKIAGGKLVKWLRRTGLRKFTNAIALSDLLATHSEQWITAAVAHRDTLTHYRDIENIHALQVPLLKVQNDGDSMFSEETIVLPKMPDGTPVTDYASTLGLHVRTLVKDTLALFPHLSHDKLSYPDFDMSEPDWPSPPIK